MRVGVNLLYLRPGRVGGSEVYSRELMAALSRRGGVDLVAFCWASAASSLSSLSHEVFAVARGEFSQGARLFAENLALASQLRRTPVDVLFSPANFCAPLLPHPVPQVATIHDLQHLHFPSYFSPAQRVFRSTLFALTAWRARELIAISEFTRRDALEHLNVDPARLTKVLEGVDRAVVPVEDDRARVRRAWSLPEEYFYYPSTLAPHKNHALLIPALARARQLSGRDMRLVLTGDTSVGLQALMDRVEECRMQAAVLHLGFVPREDVLPIMAGALALVFPSRFEGFGLPILEANQCGIPVVASTAGSIPEVAGDAAILASPDDVESWAEAMVQVAVPRNRAALVARGARNVERFSWDRCAAETEAVLRKACRRGT